MIDDNFIELAKRVSTQDIDIELVKKKRKQSIEHREKKRSKDVNKYQDNWSNCAANIYHLKPKLLVQ